MVVAASFTRYSTVVVSYGCALQEAAVPFHKFMGERILKDVTEPAGQGESYGSHLVIARTMSNATTDPDKTFYGCTYRFEMPDKDGVPL